MQHSVQYIETHTNTHGVKHVITLIHELLFCCLNVRLSSVEIAFLEEYARTMGPVSKALNILQAETDVQMGWLLPTLTLLITKLDKIRINSRYCKPLVDAVQEGLQHRFAEMLVEPEFIAAAILVPKFKTSWTSDENIIQLGKATLIIHLYVRKLIKLASHTKKQNP